MASTLIVHVIGVGVLLALLVAMVNYGSAIYEETRYTNLQRLYEDIALAIAGKLSEAILDALVRGLNNTIIQLANPVESASGEKYNVYIGSGVYLSKLFPRIPADTGLYVAVASPDNTIYGYARIIDKPVELARGQIVIDKYREGFDPGYGYSEGGSLFLCRIPINISEKAGVNLTGYPVLVNLSYAGINCSYLGRVFTPTRNDVRFTDSDGMTPLNYYIEYWNDTSKQALIWVKIPFLKAGETRTIYMYWGNPYAIEKNDPSLFTFFDNLGVYNNITDLLLSGKWGIKYGNTSSLNVTGGGANLTISAGYQNNPGYVNVYTLRDFWVNGTQGYIVEALGRPVSTGKDSDSQNYRAGFYTWNTTARKYGLRLIPTVIDPSINISHYTIIYGNWSITLDPESVEPESVNYVVANNAVNNTVVKEKSIAIAQRSINSTGNYASILYKIKVPSDNVLRGLVLSDKLVNESTQAFALLLKKNKTSIYVCSLDVDSLLKTGNEKLNCSKINPAGSDEWFYINVTIRSPSKGQGNPELNMSVYTSTGEIIYQLHRSGTQGLPGDPAFIGPMVYYDGVLEEYNGSFFDDLIALRYSEPVDLTTIKVVGLPPGWRIEVRDGNYTVSSVVNESGIAVLNVSTHPILGVTNPVEILVYDSNETLVDYYIWSEILSGGMILVYAPGIEGSTASTSAMIHATANKINIGKSCSVPSDKTYVFILNNGSIVCNTTGNIAWGSDYLTSVGYYNGVFYYYIYTPSRTLVANCSIPAGSYKPLLLKAVFGVSLEGEVPPGQVKDINTTGVFTRIMVRPFVYPEPLAVYNPSLTQNASFPKPPIIIAVERAGYIVFSSDLAVDLSVVLGDRGSVTVVIAVKGVRGG